MNRRDFITGALAGAALVAVPTVARRIWQVPRGAPVPVYGPMGQWTNRDDWLNMSCAEFAEKVMGQDLPHYAHGYMEAMRERIEAGGGKLQVISTPYRKRDWMKDFVPAGFDEGGLNEVQEAHVASMMKPRGYLRVSSPMDAASAERLKTLWERDIPKDGHKPMIVCDDVLDERLAALRRAELSRGIQLAEPVRFVTIDGFVELEKA